MRILLLSDIHGNLPALEAVLDDAGSVDHVICLGDFVGYFPFINEVIEIIVSCESHMCVMGNHDYSLLNEAVRTGSRSADMIIDRQREVIKSTNKDFLRHLPEFHRSAIDDFTCCLFHGTPRDPLNGRDAFWDGITLEQGIYLFGHSHIPFLKKDPASGWTVTNPGSCGFPRDGDPRSSYAIVDTRNRDVSFHRVEYSVERTINQCKIMGYPDHLMMSIKAGRWVSGTIQ